MVSKKDNKSNQLTQSLWLLIPVIAGLLLIRVFPEIKLGNSTIRKMDILSDLHPDPPEKKLATTDSLNGSSETDSLYIPFDPSVTRLEDYSNDARILRHFFNALNQVKKEPVRIAFYGDSFIEGDIISATLRDTLQEIFGGNGVGWVPLASETAGFRKSVKHTYSNWDTYSLISPDANLPIGISGYTYVPRANNVVTFKPGKVPPQANFKTVRVYYRNSGSGTLYFQINDEPETSVELIKTSSVDRITLTHDGIESIQFRVEPSDQVYIYGVSFEDRQGIYVDNFSLRRNSGIALSRLSTELLKQFNEYLNYKLIILQYGLNVASETDSSNYDWYADKMVSIIKNLKTTFPQSSFLLLGVSDRGVNKDGRIVTMEAIPRLRNVQREIAKRSGIAFWDTFEAMGGENSIPQYTEAVPPLASKDYTHLNHLGGTKIGKKLADALLQERRNYEK